MDSSAATTIDMSLQNPGDNFLETHRFQAVRQRRAFADIQLVLKVKNADQDGDEWLRPIRDRLPEAVCLAKPMSARETRSLINACDCFASLHRAEGFGRGTGEAMFLGRLALATGWSGNMDYMTGENALLVNHQLVPVGHTSTPSAKAKYGPSQMWIMPRHCWKQCSTIGSGRRPSQRAAGGFPCPRGPQRRHLR